MLKIIFLNTWFAKVRKPFFDFLKEHKDTTDIFCFSEVSNASTKMDVGNFGSELSPGEQFKNIVVDSSTILFTELTNYLVGHTGVFNVSEELKTAKGNVPLGLANFVRNDVKVSDRKVVQVNFIEEIPNCFEKIIQVFQVEKEGKKYWVNNMHGISIPGTKIDNEDRLTQSKNVCAVLEKESGLKILGGDFNLMPDTESIRIIEKSGLRNLITEFGITETRSRINHSQYPGREQHFADFAFVSESVKVKRFEVPRIEISDHLPLILEVE